MTTPHPLGEGEGTPLPWRYPLGTIVTWTIDPPTDPPPTYRIIGLRYEEYAWCPVSLTYLLAPLPPHRRRWSAWWAYEVHVRLREDK